MADALASVPNDIENKKRALLEAVASGGSAGLQAFQSGQKAMETARGQAIDTASALAGLIGGPESQGFAPQAGSVYDRRIADMAASQDQFGQSFAARGVAHKNYLDQVNAAVPLVRANTERDLALKRLELAEENQTPATVAELFESLSDSELKNVLSGQAENLIGPGGAYAGQDKNEVARALGAFHTMSGSAAPPRISGLFPRQTAPKGSTVQNIMGWARTDEKTAKAIDSDTRYHETRNDIASRLATGQDWESVDALLRQALLTQNPPKTRTYQALVSEWKSQFDKAGL